MGLADLASVDFSSATSSPSSPSRHTDCVVITAINKYLQFPSAMSKDWACLLCWT